MPLGALMGIEAMTAQPGAGAAPNSRDRHRLGRSSLLTISLLMLMVGSVVSGFLYTGQQQARLEELREHTKTMRTARQAVMETHAAVLDLMSRPQSPRIASYITALNWLNTFSRDDFPAPESAETSAGALVEGLKADWGEIVSALSEDRIEAAKALYAARGVQADLSRLIETIAGELDAKEAIYSEVNRNISWATAIVLGLQIVTGVFCIAVFLGAARNSARDTLGRDLAIARATASREQVLRLFEMTEMLQSALDLGDANAVLQATAAELIPDLGGALYVFNSSRDRLTLSTSWGRRDQAALPEAIGLQQCWALKRGKSHLNRPGSSKLCCEHHLVGDSALEIPMIARGEILGLMQIYCDGEQAQERLAEAAGLGTALADAMSLALSNIALRDKLRSQALRDPLTGLYNRRYMEDALERTVRLAEREKTEVSVIMIDLDHFKRLNDQYGHAKGDAVLRDAAAVITSQLRETDIACRYGGEELIVVLPHCGLEMAAAKAERIRSCIEALSEPNGAEISASLGVACVPTTSHSGRELLANADAALYRAKQEGRNRVMRAPAPKARSARPSTLMAAE